MKTHLHDVAMIPVQAQSDTWVEHGGKEEAQRQFCGRYKGTCLLDGTEETVESAGLPTVSIALRNGGQSSLSLEADEGALADTTCQLGQVLRQRQSVGSPAGPDRQALTAQMPAESHSWWQKLHGLMNLHQPALQRKTAVCGYPAKTSTALLEGQGHVANAAQRPQLTSSPVTLDDSTFRSSTITPVEELPAHTPKSSTTWGKAQHSPLASRAPLQQVPTPLLEQSAVVLHVKVLQRRDESGVYPSWLVQTCNELMPSVSIHVADRTQRAAKQQDVRDDSQDSAVTHHSVKVVTSQLEEAKQMSVQQSGSATQSNRIQSEVLTQLRQVPKLSTKGARPVRDGAAGAGAAQLALGAGVGMGVRVGADVGTAVGLGTGTGEALGEAVTAGVAAEVRVQVRGAAGGFINGGGGRASTRGNSRSQGGPCDRWQGCTGGFWQGIGWGRGSGDGRLSGCKRGTKQGLGGRGRAGGSHTAADLALLGAGESAAALSDSIICALVHSIAATDDLAEHCDAGAAAVGREDAGEELVVIGVAGDDVTVVGEEVTAEDGLAAGDVRDVAITPAVTAGTGAVAGDDGH
ncbi:MAG: hypothetical protein FRX49_00825 [Trebouxia sp. A1-2]|nr:MAG: hypothetical protein FRX49_00825 [Trebouxia sp. A1-2]